MEMRTPYFIELQHKEHIWIVEKGRRLKQFPSVYTRPDGMHGCVDISRMDKLRMHGLEYLNQTHNFNG